MKYPTVSEIIRTVRSDPYLGKGSASYMDETYTDKELSSLINDLMSDMKSEGKTITKESMLRELTRVENLWRETDAQYPVERLKS